VKLDREFQDEVVIGVFKHAAEISSSVDDLIDTLAAVAALGRLISYRYLFPSTSSSLTSAAPSASSASTSASSSTSSSSPTSSSGQVDISYEQLQQLPARKLIQLLWAHGRLPEGMLTESTLINCRRLLLENSIDPAESTDVSYDDLMLYVRNCVDSHAASAVARSKEACSDDGDEVCKILTNSLLNYYSTNETVDNETVLLEQSLRTDSYNAAYLSDLAQAYLELNWCYADASKLFTSACHHHHHRNSQHEVDIVKSKGLQVLLCNKYFNLGKLEALAAAYETRSHALLHAKEKKESFLGKIFHL